MSLSASVPILNLFSHIKKTNKMITNKNYSMFQISFRCNPNGTRNIQMQSPSRIFNAENLSLEEKYILKEPSNIQAGKRG